MRVRMILEDQFIGPQKSGNVRLVVYPEAFLFLHRASLVVEVLLRHLQRAHSVTFQPESKGQLVRRKRFEIIRPFAGGGAIHRSSSVRNPLKMRGLWNVLRALEHHVFEEMRKARSTDLFISGTCVVIDRD